MRTQIKTGGLWVDGTPVIGEWYRQQTGIFADGQIAWEEKRNVEEVLLPAPIEIIITGITGDEMHSSDFTKSTMYEETNITITGTLPIPNKNFALPIRRNDGRLFVFLASVVDGVFSVVINFPSCGSFVYSSEECNIDFPYEVFTVSTMKFDVLRRIAL